MSKILVIDTAGDSWEAICAALRAAGWEATPAVSSEPAHERGFDAIVLATDVGSMGSALQELASVRAEQGVPVLLAVDLDRSGWDRTFGSPEGLGVDALLDRPVNTGALVARLRGILEARQRAGGEATPELSTVLERAIANEEAAEAFYRRAAGYVTLKETREVLEMLAAEEKEHKRLLEEFRNGQRPLPSGRTAVGSLVESFGTPELTPELEPADAFLLAARKEKLAVEFYENWASLYPHGPERDLLSKLAEVERRHKAHVEAMFSNAAFPESW